MVGWIYKLCQCLYVTTVPILAWVIVVILPDRELRMFTVLTLSAWCLLPVRYRQVGSGNESHWIRIPYLVVGLCELANVVFDRIRFTSDAEK